MPGLVAMVDISELPDADLVRLHRGGNRRASATLITRYEWVVRHWVQRIGGRTGEATREDLMQEGRLALHSAVARFDPDRADSPDKFRAFATTWVRRQVRDKFRQQLRQRRDLVSLVGFDQDGEMVTLELADPTPSVERQLEAGQIRERLDRAIDRLPPRLAFVLRQRFVEGRTQDDIGRELHVIPQRVAQLERAGLNKLGEILGGRVAVVDLLASCVE